ncbi:MAG: protein-L-isoaspartate(D-aspartate) O-methyltransferase [Methylococcaceae bacterium]|nr:MAG: protein-L-isoaspartate(D-aspartate) O-methyltransferase [Methylococcaceae bacterium]
MVNVVEPPFWTPDQEQAFAARRAALLAEIGDEARLTALYTGRHAFSPAVMAAVGRVLRHAFVPPDQLLQAYYNCPLPIGHGQTISQPYIVALMSDLLDVDAHSVVLEVGTGCGYQAAVLAEMVRRIYSLERLPDLAESARRRLHSLGYDNVEVMANDGYYGHPAHAPYDGIIVTAAAEAIPAPLIEQLKPGGRLVIPLGRAFGDQQLVRAVKQPDGSLQCRAMLPVAFVPFRH